MFLTSLRHLIHTSTLPLKKDEKLCTTKSATSLGNAGVSRGLGKIQIKNFTECVLYKTWELCAQKHIIKHYLLCISYDSLTQVGR